MTTIQELYDDKTIQKIVTDIAKKELGDDSNVIAHIHLEGAKFKISLFTDMGRIVIVMHKSATLEYLDYFITTEIQDEKGHRTLKNEYEEKHKEELLSIKEQILNSEGPSEVVAILSNLDFLMRDIFVCSDHWQDIQHKLR